MLGNLRESFSRRAPLPKNFRYRDGTIWFLQARRFAHPFGLRRARIADEQSPFEISLVRLSDTHVSSLREAVPREHSSNGREAHLDRSCADQQTSTLPYIRPDFFCGRMESPQPKRDFLTPSIRLIYSRSAAIKYVQVKGIPHQIAA